MKRPTKETTNGKRHGFLLLSGLAFLLVSLFLLINFETPEEKRSGLPDNDNPVLPNSTVSEIASKFICACGSCNGESLDICGCDHAKKVRQAISAYLRQNKNPEQIISLIAKSYGGLKPLFDKNSIENNKIPVTDNGG